MVTLCLLTYAVLTLWILWPAADHKKDPFTEPYSLTVEDFGTSNQLVFQADPERIPLTVDYLILSTPANNTRYVVVSPHDSQTEIKSYFEKGKTFKAKFWRLDLEQFPKETPHISFHSLLIEHSKK